MPTQPTSGYVHWSSFLYGDKAKLGTDLPFKALDGWSQFTCPSLPNGGPPANTFAGNDDGLPNESGANVIDWQVPRVAFTLNEALAPRRIFRPGFADRGNVRVYRFVKAGSVRNAAGTILGAELSSVQRAVTGKSLIDGATLVSASRRPVNGFTSAVNPDEPYRLPYRSAYTRATDADLDRDPEANAGGSPQTLLDFVGRNHGRRQKDARGFDARRTNFLYVDGHVETKHVRETLAPFQWGEKFYSLER